jgi:hypothetical protein
MRQAINHPVAGAPILAKTVWLKKKASIGHYYGGSCIPALRRLPSFPMDHAPITGQQVIPSKNEKTSHWIRREPLGRHLPMPSAKKKWHTKWYISGINLPKAVTERMRSGLGQGGARNYNRRDVPRVYAFRIAWHRLRNRIDGPPEAHPFVLRPSLLDRRLLVSTNTGGFRASQGITTRPSGREGIWLISRAEALSYPNGPYCSLLQGTVAYALSRCRAGLGGNVTSLSRCSCSRLRRSSAMAHRSYANCLAYSSRTRRTSSTIGSSRMG